MSFPVLIKRAKKVIVKVKEALTKMQQYRDGGKGFVLFCEENCFVPIYPEGSDIPEWFPMHSLPKTPHPETGKSYWSMWNEQKKILLKALEMKNSRFLFRLIVLCWPRGEGKSIIACLILIWKFFCWPRQKIMLGANSKDQVKFVHYDIIRDIIHNSPNLLAQVGGKKNIQEKEVRLRDIMDNVVSLIRSISSFSGIVSNITGYSFSEIFDMKNPKFFVQLDGSIRNIPNAFGVIDSTVSAKTHILYQLHEGVVKKKTKGVFFSYRFSRSGEVKDYWNPNMTKDQLDDYRIKFPFGEFERYFQNLWSAGSEDVFTQEMVEAWEYLGLDGELGKQEELLRVLAKKNTMIEQANTLEARNLEGVMEKVEVYASKLEERLRPVEEVYSLRTKQNYPVMATIEDLEKLGDVYDTDWGILLGLDRGDPLKVSTSARTAVIAIAKGLPGSRSTPEVFYEKGVVPAYIYVLLHLTLVENHSLEIIKDIISSVNSEFDGIDSICSERWGVWDMIKWLEEQGLAIEPVFPTYDKQKASFTEFFIIVRQGRFKAPPIVVPGSVSENILAEEALVFDHDIDKRTFGSPEKSAKYGIQDDTMFGTGWCIYGGRELGVENFRPRKGTIYFGSMVRPRGMVGNYG